MERSPFHRFTVDMCSTSRMEECGDKKIWRIVNFAHHTPVDRDKVLVRTAVRDCLSQRGVPNRRLEDVENDKQRHRCPIFGTLLINDDTLHSPLGVLGPAFDRSM